jgi:hypothetical protein
MTGSGVIRRLGKTHNGGLRFTNPRYGLYLEKNFSLLPQECCGRSLAFDLLRTMRLSLRKIAKYGKHGPTS